MPNSLQPHGRQPMDGQASLFMGFSRQEYWSGLLCPPPGDLSNPGIEPPVDLPNPGIEPPGDLPNPGIASRFFTIWAYTKELRILEIAQSLGGEKQKYNIIRLSYDTRII